MIGSELSKLRTFKISFNEFNQTTNLTYLKKIIDSNPYLEIFHFDIFITNEKGVIEFLNFLGQLPNINDV